MKTAKINQCKDLIEEIGGKIDKVSENVIVVDDGLWCVLVEEEEVNELSLSFHLDIDPRIAANIAMELSNSSSKIGMKVVIGESYAFKTDEQGVIIETVFGEDAYEIAGRVPLGY